MFSLQIFLPGQRLLKKLPASAVFTKLSWTPYFIVASVFTKKLKPYTERFLMVIFVIILQP